MNINLFLAQQTTASSELTERQMMGMVIFYACLGVIVLIVTVAKWIVYSKAGHMGIASIIPIWSDIVLLQIAGMPWWYVILLFIPLVNLLILLAAHFGVAQAFGQGTLFGLGLFFLSPIFWILLAFDDYEYIM